MTYYKAFTRRFGRDSLKSSKFIEIIVRTLPTVDTH